MNRKGLLKHLIILMFFIFLADILAKHFYWYFSIWYFDMIMHFLGGVWAGLFFIWFFYGSGLDSKSLASKVIKIFLFVLVVGVIWELFEIFANNHIAQEPFNALDSASDVFFDLAGGGMAAMYFLRKIKLPPLTPPQ